MTNFVKLCRVLEREASLQEKVLALLTSERAAIVKLEQDRVQQIREQKEQLLGNAKVLEEDRREVLRALHLEVGSSATLTLEQLLPHCSETTVRSRLHKAGVDLRNTVTTVQQLNSENGSLLRQSLGLIASTLAILQARPESNLPTYGQKGKLPKGDGDPLFSSRSSSFSKAI